ncbi:MAG: hypothetical protein HY774_28840 [Acidobacteria bacterium]|nr:hypothetical protein [Acidobacteriota bacterium]
MTKPIEIEASPQWGLKNEFQIELVMESDWHVGSGTGRPGNVDRLVIRDQDKFPFVPAKTVTGIWRDACELVALGLDDGNSNGSWLQLVKTVFGSQPSLVRESDRDELESGPTPAGLKITPARLSESLRTTLCQNHLSSFRQALTFVKPGIAIDPDSGSAKKDFLRFEEMARGGMRLTATCSLDLPVERIDRHAVSALLLAGARLVKHLGGKRRRGAGRCTLNVGNPKQFLDVVNWLETNNPNQNSHSTDESNAEQPLGNSKRPGQWFKVELKLELKTPLAIVTRTLGNVAETLDFVPGTYLLPFVTKLLKKIGFDPHPAFAGGELMVLPATPVVHNQRGLPVPFALSKDKLADDFEPEKVINRFKESASEQQMKPYREGFISDTTEKILPSFEKTHRSLLTHNVVEDQRQRPTEEVGGVYSREAIAAGTILRTELRFTQNILDELNKKENDWWKRLEETCRLGVSSKDDYGEVQVCVVSEPRFVTRTIPISEDTLTVWLVSDVLLRDAALRPTTDVCDLAQALERNLTGVTLKVQKPPMDQLITSLIRTRRIESWQTKWGLPRPSLVALAAGSCVQFAVTGTITADQLAQIEASGIGERRGEGYGQVRFNDPLLTSRLNDWKPVPDPKPEGGEEKKNDPGNGEPPKLVPKDDPDFAFFKQLETVVWQEAIERAALHLANEESNRKKVLGIKIKCSTDGKPESEPSLSQLGSLRAVIRKVQHHSEKTLIRDWVEHLRKTPNRKDKWPDGALKKVEGLIDDAHEAIWKVIESSAGKLPPVCTVDGETRLKEFLWPYALQTVVEAVLRAHKRDCEPRKGDTGYGA